MSGGPRAARDGSRLAAALALSALWAAGGGARAGELVPVATPALGAPCDDLDAAGLVAAIERQLPALRAMPATPGFRFGPRVVSPADYARTTLAPLAELARKGTAALCAALPERFAFYRNAGVGPGTFTAYHNPIFLGSRSRSERFRFPLYRNPGGALSRLPTADILAGALDGKGLELVFLADGTEALAAHVEGSATLRLDDGTLLDVSTDGHNGLPFYNVSKAVIAAHVIPRDQRTPLAMTPARKYLVDHPDQLPVYWAKNPHFVFFKESQRHGSGRFGELLPGRSLAVDPAATPLGLALWIRSDKPAIAGERVQAWVSFGRVALAQDTGSGIVGAGRVDVFFGTGEYAAAASAVTTRPGEVYALLAR